MLIGIDGNEANIKERVGVNVWAFELLKQLAERLPQLRQTQLRNDVSIQIYLSRPPLPDLPPESEDWQYRVIPPARFWTRWRLPLDLYVHEPRPDIFLSLSHYAPKWAPMPRVVSIMDLSFLKYPRAFQPLVYRQLRDWTRESVKNAAHVITISEFNKREIAKEYHYPKEKITVVYPGVSETFRQFSEDSKGRSLQSQGPSLSDKYSVAKKYLLFVGTQQPKKNLRRLIKAFEIAGENFPNVELVVAGKIWKQFSEIAILRQTQDKLTSRNDRVKYLGYVPEEDLPALMAEAEALVMPSLYEGFGIPVVEAVSVGTIVATSNTTSLPEVVGDSGFLFDPLDVNDIAKTLEKILRLSPAERKEISKKGMIRSKMFSWEKAAEDVLRTVLAVR